MINIAIEEVKGIAKTEFMLLGLALKD
jgi:hypothetical protein